MPHHYFDHNATTPLAPAVRAAYVEALDGVYGNASSIHQFGQLAKQRLEEARRRVAARLSAHPKEIVFLSGGTEGDNLALRGVARPGSHIVTTAIEHPAVLNTCAALEREGAAVTYVPVGASGIVDPDAIGRALKPNTILVSVMHANNELGTIQPITEIARITRAAGVLLHSDGVQAFGKIEAAMDDLQVDLYTISGHKAGAPKGIGALYIRGETLIRAVSFGGRHERERRPGTENVPGAAALGCAAETAGCSGVALLRDRLECQILERVPAAHVNGADHRVPNTTNMRFDGIEGEALLISLDLRGFAVSSGAACSSGAVEPSHVLTAIGLSPRDARSSLRFSLGPSNTASEVDALTEAVVQSVAHLRRISTDSFPAKSAHAYV
ncbi:MAG: cysteine desulfurase [Acidobacteriota bacterium]|nr:cysteine desulfurase [Acidobacteriota bacterium]